MSRLMTIVALAVALLTLGGCQGRSSGSGPPIAQVGHGGGNADH